MTTYSNKRSDAEELKYLSMALSAMKDAHAFNVSRLTKENEKLRLLLGPSADAVERSAMRQLILRIPIEHTDGTPLLEEDVEHSPGSEARAEIAHNLIKVALLLTNTRGDSECLGCAGITDFHWHGD